MKKWIAAFAAGVMILGCTACGKQGSEGNTETVNVLASDVQTEDVQKEDAETEAAQTKDTQTKAVETEAAQTEDVQTQAAQTEDAQTEGSQAEIEAEEKNDNADDLEEKGTNGEIGMFAEKIQAAVAGKDMEALAALCNYPLAVNGEVIEDKEALLELGEDVIFTEERCAVIAAVDVSALEESMAGVVMGEATPNIIFKSVDGNLGITGIN
ncbi:MAG: hypothetical protein K2P65_00705 [Lachnospiraceae bacterium]|nr:hypothetical protein [Lachnospiraceae bacterium]